MSMKRLALPLAYALLTTGLLAGCGTYTYTTPAPGPSTLMQDMANIGSWASANPQGCNVLIATYIKNVETTPGETDTPEYRYAHNYLAELKRDCRTRNYEGVRITGGLIVAWARDNGATPT